ncbi:ciliary microtubule inner protein 5-like [Amphiura filiformis]|uniref:ciliary microtubule inner protein 5-like n=1 Tax=Amphiura filiformis TaxID=82378 RepID=UPI003B22384F
MGDVSYSKRYENRHDRATSAGYRFPDHISPPSRASSAYHNNCIPAERKREIHSAPPAASRRHTAVDYRKCDAVTEDRIWRESVGREQGAIKKWDEGWGFLKDYDKRGNLKEKEKPPENLTKFSESVPNTSNQVLGHRQSTTAAKTMISLQHKLSIGHQKKRNKDLIYVD